MSTTTEPRGIERYAERTPEQAERLAHLQDHRAGLRPVDAGLVSATLEAVEMIGGAATALESCPTAGWSEGAVAKLRMVANLLLEQDCRRMEEYARWFGVAELPFLARGNPARQVLRALARSLPPERAEVLYEAADRLWDAYPEDHR